MSDVVLRPLSKGEILDGAFTLLRRNFVAFVGSAAVFMVPACLVTIARPELGTFASAVANFCVWGAAVRVAADAVTGHAPSIGSACTTGVRKFLPLLLNYVGFVLAITIGIFLLVVPGLLIAVMGFALAQVIVVENRWNPFPRSRALAKEAWGKISLLMFLSSIITALPSIAVFGMAAMFSSATADLLMQSGTRPSVWIDVTAALLACFTTPFSQSVLTLLYFDQRVRKEGLGIEMQAAALPPSAPKAG